MSHCRIVRTLDNKILAFFFSLRENSVCVNVAFSFRFYFQICDSTPFVSDLQDLSILDTEYVDDPIYSSKLKHLASKYKSIRKTRPDGNCFFRAFAYAYLEYLVKNKEDYQKFHELSVQSKDRLIMLGFPQFTLEDFHDTVK